MLEDDVEASWLITFLPSVAAESKLDSDIELTITPENPICLAADTRDDG